MERNFNNEFERFLKENADQYRLYPSAKVWRGVYNTLHTRRKWYGAGIILLLLTGSLVGVLVTHSSKEIATITPNKSAVINKETITHNLQVVRPDKRISENKSINNSAAITENKKLIVQGDFYSILQNSPITQENNSQSIIATNNLTPIDIRITDEATDQNITGNSSSPKISDYPKKLTASNPFGWTIESVLNSFKRPKNRKFSMQFSFTPTISYRKLTANKAFLRSANLQANSPASFAALYDVNSAVTHKPDIGLELGLTSKYALTKNFKVKAGIQFNVNRYDIKAFNYRWELTTIALRSGRGVDSFSTVSSHRNFNGYKSDWLQNFYFEISMPVGLEVNIIGDDKVQFGIAGTIQPTYILGDRAYLLSTDYKNYAEVPWLIRRWNISTGFETFVAYSTGKMKWQVGPQVRYQLLSSFVDKYPVKENLFDFGLKVGISLNK
jgi:hypothetical protein